MLNHRKSLGAHNLAHVRREDKRFVSTICVNDKKYRSIVGQPNVRMSEQVAALAALHGMNIRCRLEGNWEED
uniref:DRBM domain-containing protein n=1 Tax=Caenorhabditis japonica TaxID=281687 RepID=A0A8R1E8L6_CAEJA